MSRTGDGIEQSLSSVDTAPGEPPAVATTQAWGSAGDVDTKAGGLTGEPPPSSR